MDEQPVTARRLLELARPQLPLLTAATAALVVSAAMSLSFPLVVRWIVDLVVAEGDLHKLDQAAGVLVVVFAAQTLFGAMRAWLFTLAGERVVAKLRSDLFEAVLHQEVGFFDATRTGELTSRLAADTAVLQNTVTVNVSMALRFALGVFGGIGMLFWVSPTLTMVALAVVPVVAIGASVFGRWIRSLSKEVQDALAVTSEVAEESISGVRTVRAFAGEHREQARYDKAVQDSYALAARRALAYGAFNGVIGFAGFFALALVVWFGGRMVLSDTMSMGDLVAFLLYTLNVAVSLTTLSGLYADFMRATGASTRVFQLLDREPLIERDEGVDVGEIVGAVTFDKVTFAYPTREDMRVLDDIQLEVQPGEVVALVGPSGAGKSTVASMLLRFYDPQSGRILLDGRDITELEPHALRRSIGIVSQEPILFATTIADNIRYARPEASMDEVRAAAVAANAATFIEDFPEGFETAVGERGVRLSGGQKQRVAIARALLKDPAILVLDEATSALDAENEHLVQEALDRLMEGRTTFVIAHRLSTIQGADRVVVLDGGRVVEQGGHDTLVAAGGLYHKLVERQFSAAG